ncbi:MAG: T9SS type A sorting domain-containing protein [Chitinophagaceae bacterium]|jgi:hypothetical protein|nr:T9SS type A sorting domain-containing protein [Chitinophagaceae bacterium]
MNQKLLTAFFILLCGTRVMGTDYTVNNTTDGNATNQLRGAIMAAAASAGPHTITLAAGTYTLTNGQIIFGAIATNIKINGASASQTIITTQGANADRLLLINETGTVNNVVVEFTNIQFRGGRLKSDPFGGGAILCGGPGNQTKFTDCIFHDNSIAAGGGTSGGAINQSGGGLLELQRCTFTNNQCSTGEGGAVYYFLQNNVSGSLVINQCTFNNNSAVNFSGGAVGVGVQGTQGSTTSAVAITRSTFTANQAPKGNGGAIFINNGFSQSNNAIVQFNRFAGNTAQNAATTGLAMVNAAGNVVATNNWWGANSGPAAGPADRAAQTATGGTGTLTATPYLVQSTMATQTTLCNFGTPTSTTVTTGITTNNLGNAIAAADRIALLGVPVAFTFSGGSLANTQVALDANAQATTTYNAALAGPASVLGRVDNVPTNDASAVALTIRQAATITTQPADVTACLNGSGTFTAAASGFGTLTYAWYRGATLLANGATGNGSTLSGTQLASLVIANAAAADAASNYEVRVTNVCRTVSSNPVALQVSQGTLPTAATTTASITGISATNFVAQTNTCQTLAAIVPSGASPITGNVTVRAFVQPAVPVSPAANKPYLQRHFDIATSTTNAQNLTSTVTLYCTQQEFTAFNAYPGVSVALPTGPADAAGKANLRVYKFFGTNAGGQLAGYNQGGVAINPDDDDIVWNAGRSRWEISFDNTGFSGFFISNTDETILPLTLGSLRGSLQQGLATLAWATFGEKDIQGFEVQRSTNGINFEKAGWLQARNLGGEASYTFRDPVAVLGKVFYRLEVKHQNGSRSFSAVVALQAGAAGQWQVTALPNPFTRSLQLQYQLPATEKVSWKLSDAAGRVVLAGNAGTQPAGSHTQVLQLGNLAPGLYLLQVEAGTHRQTLRLMRQ